MIRVLQITGKPSRGGVESVVLNWYQTIDKTRIQFDFVVDGYDLCYLDQDIPLLGGKVFHTEKYSKNLCRVMWDVYKIVKSEKPDIVHCHMSTLASIYLLPAMLAGAKVRIAHSHGTGSRGEGLRYFLKLLLRPTAGVFASKLAACSKVAGQWMFGEKKLEQQKVEIINNAINLKKFKFNSDRRAVLRNRYNLDGKLVLGHVGRFSREKNQIFILKIFENIFSRNKNSILVFVGDGPLRPEIEKEVVRLGLEDKVIFLGIRKDVYDLMQIMDVFLLPSYYEGNPVSAIEAQASGLPVITSTTVTLEAKVSSIFERISLSAPVEVWADACIRIAKGKRISHTEEVKLSGFSIDEVIHKVESMYESLASES